jgi:hypothetical protein
MDKMILGSYTFEWNPTNYTIPKLNKSWGKVDTYSSSATFSWGTFIVGQEVEIEWKWMKEAQFDELQTLLEADAEVTWTPQTGTTYQVEIMDLEGKLFLSSLTDAPYRLAVRLLLVIKSVN